MRRGICYSSTRQNKQRGIAAVEFALISFILFTLLFGITEFGRILFLMNAATEATRLGARLAVVCDLNESTIKQRMQNVAGFLDPGNILISYIPSNCTREDCQFVTVRILPEQKIASLVSYLPVAFNMPSLATTLPRESMASTFYGEINPVCAP